MARKFSDSNTAAPSMLPAMKDKRAVFVVANEPAYLEQVFSLCTDAPATAARYSSLDALFAALGQFERLPLAFVILVFRRGTDLDIPALRRVRLEYPQLVMIAVLGECDQQSALRLQSIGVHGILLPPFERISLGREIATAVPNVPNFKRHPGLMRRASVRLDFLIPSDLTYVIGINYHISNLLKEFGYPPQDTRVNIPLACDEAITNAIVHGNGSDPDKRVGIQIYVSPNRFRMRVRDEGNGFRLEDVSNPTQGDALLRASGRGVYLMKNIMDSVEFKEGGRVVELEKRNTANGNGGGNAA
jgi:serine/threonine-protein kinase RsbW